METGKTLDGKPDAIHLVYGTDDNYLFPTLVSAASAAKCLGKERQLVIHLFDAGVTDEHWHMFNERVSAICPRVSCVRHVLSPDMFKDFGKWKGSVVTYSRMFMAELLEDLDWAIYFDGDTLWTGDIGKLWDLRDETKLIQASVDPPTPMGNVNPEFFWYRDNGLEIDRSKYLCMGLMLANLKKMREEGVAEKCREFMRRYPNPHLVDQTVLNFVCAGQTAALPVEWGVFSAWHGNADLTKDGAVHYVSDVPWRRDKINRLLSDIVLLWFDFCRVVLQDDQLPKTLGLIGRWWRRFIFCMLKHNQWMLAVHPFVKSRLRNTHGLRPEELAAIHKRLLA